MHAPKDEGGGYYCEEVVGAARSKASLSGKNAGSATPSAVRVAPPRSLPPIAQRGITIESASGDPGNPTCRGRGFGLARGNVPCLGYGSCTSALVAGSDCRDRDPHLRLHQLYARSPHALSASGHRTRS